MTNFFTELGIGAAYGLAKLATAVSTEVLPEVVPGVEIDEETKRAINLGVDIGFAAAAYSTGAVGVGVGATISAAMAAQDTVVEAVGPALGLDPDDVGFQVMGIGAAAAQTVFTGGATLTSTVQGAVQAGSGLGALVAREAGATELAQVVGAADSLVAFEPDEAAFKLAGAAAGAAAAVAVDSTSQDSDAAAAAAVGMSLGSDLGSAGSDIAAAPMANVVGQDGKLTADALSAVDREVQRTANGKEWTFGDLTLAKSEDVARQGALDSGVIGKSRVREGVVKFMDAGVQMAAAAGVAEEAKARGAKLSPTEAMQMASGLKLISSLEATLGARAGSGMTSVSTSPAASDLDAANMGSGSLPAARTERTTFSVVGMPVKPEELAAAGMELGATLMRIESDLRKAEAEEAADTAEFHERHDQDRLARGYDEKAEAARANADGLRVSMGEGLRYLREADKRSSLT